MTPIEYYRRSNKLSLRGLSAASQVSIAKLHHAEHGRDLSVDEYSRLASALKCPVDALRARAVCLVFEPAAQVVDHA